MLVRMPDLGEVAVRLLDGGLVAADGHLQRLVIARVPQVVHLPVSSLGFSLSLGLLVALLGLLLTIVEGLIDQLSSLAAAVSVTEEHDGDHLDGTVFSLLHPTHWQLEGGPLSKPLFQLLLVLLHLDTTLGLPLDELDLLATSPDHELHFVRWDLELLVRGLLIGVAVCNNLLFRQGFALRQQGRFLATLLIFAQPLRLLLRLHLWQDLCCHEGVQRILLRLIFAQLLPQRLLLLLHLELRP
mmetsp:Transcript_20685/g.62333  ORF Transcript_20685/g.62333 Transcript_20685/m.62333 type:complete len:242 (+) Transcript_20685:459-1184(+)